MTQTDDARGPDWEGFGRDLLESWPVRDVDGSELFDAALRNGLIVEIPGGYDPDQHIDAEGICPEAGDPWYEYAFHPARADLAPTPQDDPRVGLTQAATIAETIMQKHAKAHYSGEAVRVFKSGDDTLSESAAKAYCAGEILEAIRAAIAALSPTGGKDE